MSARPLRVALLSPRFWPEVRRGTERFARDLADGLRERGHTPRILTSHRGLPSRSVEDGVRVVRVPRLPDARLRRRLWEQDLTHLPFAYLALRAGDDDVAQALYPTDALAALRWSRRTGRPAILSYMGVAHRRGLANRRFRIEVIERAATGCATVIVLSRAAADGFQRWLGVRPRVIAPGVDLDAFSPGGERAEVPTVFCAAAADEPRKRVDLLVAAHRHVRRERPGARLVISLPRDRQVAARLRGAGRGVELVDVDDPGALLRANREAWVSALPSRDEAFGLVLVEALACGTPVVGADSGALPELIDDERVGRLFSGDDPRDVARAILKAFELAADSATRSACRRHAERFSRERCAAAYEALYRELLGQHGA